MTAMTPGGSEVFRHGDPTGTEDVPDYDEAKRAAIEAHLSSFLPGEPSVLHEIVSTGLHLGVFVWEPTEERPLWTLVTLGMSEREMTTPPGAEDWALAELVMTLPADWPMPDGPGSSTEVWKDPRNDWPILLLKEAGHLPHMYQTWIAYGHTLAAGPDATDRDEGSDFNGTLVAYAMSMPPEAAALEYEGRRIFFWGLYPLYEAEMDFNLQAGADALFEAFEEAGLHEGVFPGRKPLVNTKPQKRGFFGLGRK